MDTSGTVFLEVFLEQIYKQTIKISTIIEKYLMFQCLQSKFIDKKIQIGVFILKLVSFYNLFAGFFNICI